MSEPQVVRAYATLGVGDQYEPMALDIIAKLDALVDEGEPIVGVQRPEQDGPWLVDVLFADTPEPARSRWLEAAREIIPNLPPFAIDPLGERDWVAESQKALHPVPVGRFVVHGSHDRGRIPASRGRVEIDAGRAFGTAHHATTKACLLALENLAKRRPLGRVHDVGTGTGVLLIGADRLGAVGLSGGDIDPVAVRVARANVRANRISQHVDLRTHAGPFDQADTVIANILARPLIAMAGALADATRGTLILSGLRTVDRRRIYAAYRARGFVKVDEVVMDDWAALTLSRPRRPRRKGWA